MTAIMKRGVLWYFFRAPVYLYSWRIGWRLGHRLLLLTHIRRRTGLRRQAVLEVVDAPDATNGQIRMLASPFPTRHRVLSVLSKAFEAFDLYPLVAPAGNFLPRTDDDPQRTY